MENILGRCSASNIDTPSRAEVENVLYSCNGEDEEVIACLVKSLFLHNIYAGSDCASEDRYQMKSAQLNEELSSLLKDESLSRDVSYLFQIRLPN